MTGMSELGTRGLKDFGGGLIRFVKGGKCRRCCLGRGSRGRW